MTKKTLLFSSIVIAFCAMGCNQSYKKKYEDLKWENEILKESFEASKIKLQGDIDTLKIKPLKDIQVLNDSIRVLLDSINELRGLSFYYRHQSEVVKPSYWLDEYDIEVLQELGFKNPQKEILADLNKNKHLFSDDAILGGIMGIDSAVLIGTHWVLASGGDGHTGLYYLFEYTVEENKKIKWKVIHKRNLFS